jgi:sensor domain CHASE-containing protein
VRTIRSKRGPNLGDRLAGMRDVFGEQPIDDADEPEARRKRPWASLLVAVVVALLAIYFAGQTAARLWLEDLDSRLLDAGAGANALAISFEREHLEAYRAIAFSDGFPDDLRRYDVDAIEDRIQPVDANHGIPMIDLIDEQGRVVFAFRAEGAIRPYYRERMGLEVVRKSLAGERDEYGERFTSIIATEEGPLLATAGPVREGDEIIGALLLMTPVDEILSQGRNLHGAHLTAYSLDRGDPLATTTAIRPRTFSTEERTTLAQPDELPFATRFRVGGNPQREQIAALTVRHRTAAFLGAALPDRSRYVAWRVMMITALGMAVVAALVGIVVYGWTKERYEEPEPPEPPVPALPPGPPPQPTGPPTWTAAP